MAINNTEVVRFCNEAIRPMSESIRTIKYQVDLMLVAWNGGINANCPNLTTENILDGRNSEGVSRLNGADVNNVMTQLVALQTLLNQAGVESVLAKPCVRYI